MIGGIVWCRHRRRRVQLGSQAFEEESIPLTSSRQEDDGDGEMDRRRRAKGKSRAISDEENGSVNRGARKVEESERIFEVGDSDEEDFRHNK